ncbi:MAG: leucine-rich repeat domain-containing protein [Ruminococcaceae bacterium]|nr:leucine-rich repeat domain-containing protein [Oscillospiraceae bacterium]
MENESINQSGTPTDAKLDNGIAESRAAEQARKYCVIEDGVLKEFKDPDGRIEHLVIPDNVTSISGHAFWYCPYLRSVTIPNSVTEIGQGAFSSACSKLTSVSIPSSVTKIGASAFYGCAQLKNVVIPEGVVEIGAAAFYGCKWMNSVTIASSVAKVGYNAFGDCGCTLNICKPKPGIFKRHPEGWASDWKANFKGKIVWNYKG